jgi:hypothetical protein
MAFTLNDLASELGIDVATLQSKPDVVAKWNGYLTEADTKYTQATQAQKDAETKLEAVKNEQAVIDQNIAAFGMTEANVAALKANNAAMEASLKALKEQGFDVKIPDAPKNEPTKTEFDANAFRNDVNSTMILGFNVNNRYQRLFGQPMPDDIDALAREAAQVRMPFQEYVAKKYDFSGKEKEIQAAATKKHDEEIAAAAVKKYQEEHPVTSGNPDLQRGVASRHPQIIRQREAGDQKQFANLPARQKIAMSVARTRAALASNS